MQSLKWLTDFFYNSEPYKIVRPLIQSDIKVVFDLWFVCKISTDFVVAEILQALRSWCLNMLTMQKELSESYMAGKNQFFLHTQPGYREPELGNVLLHEGV